MSFEYKLPDVGEGLTEADIVSWRVKEGDVIEINDIVVEIETAKSLVELPSPYAGTVAALLVAEGETVAVGTPIIRIGDEAEDGGPEEGRSPVSKGAATETTPRRSTSPTRRPRGGGEGESLVGRNKADRGPTRRPRRGSASPASDAGAATQMQLQGAFTPGGAQSQDVVESDEPAVPGSSRRAPSPRPSRPTSARSPSRRCASWPRTSAST